MICKGVKSSFFKFLQKNRISAEAVLSRWTSRLLFSYHETYFFSFIPSLQKWRIPMSKPNILWGCERTKSSSAAPFCTKKETEVSHFAKLRMPQDAAVPYFFTRYVKQAGALSTASAVPWRPYERGHDIRRRTRAPFYEMWVKTGPWRTLQEALQSL